MSPTARGNRHADRRRKLRRPRCPLRTERSRREALAATGMALVTGGTRGIGRAVALALRAGGHQVAVVYRGNEKTAAAFRHETGLAAYRWDVGDFDAAAGVARVEADLEPIGVLADNAYLARKDAGFITGVTFSINGGQWTC